MLQYNIVINMYNVCVPLEDYEDMMCVQMIIEDQSFGDMMHVQWANSICRHIPTCMYHVRALCHVGRTIYMGNSACTNRNC